MLLRQTMSFALLLGVACGNSAAPAGDDDPLAAAIAPAAIAPTAIAKDAKKTVPAVPTKGRITGVIKVEGRVEKVELVDLTPDPYCVELHAGHPLANPIAIVKDDKGGLKDVFIHLTRNVPDKKYKAPETPFIINQVGCNYDPHVWGVMKKQDIKIVNSDATLHNIHALPRSNKEFNLAMPNQGDERMRKFKKAEDAIHIKCDVHPWMATFCFVMEHPYFAVSAADGSFSIDTADLPDGEYGVTIWHEVLGEAEGTVTVKDGSGTFEHTFETGKE